LTKSVVFRWKARTHGSRTGGSDGASPCRRSRVSKHLRRTHYRLDDGPSENWLGRGWYQVDL